MIASATSGEGRDTVKSGFSRLRRRLSLPGATRVGKVMQTSRNTTTDVGTNVGAVEETEEELGDIPGK